MTRTSLEHTQRALASAILGGAATDDPRVEIYREQFFLRHRDVLAEDFAALAVALGDAFDPLVRVYLAAHPPSSFTLRDLGAQLPAFLEDPFLADLARLEWAFVDAFDAPTPSTALDLSAIAAITIDEWPLVTVTLDPALQRLSLAYPAHVFRLETRERKKSAARTRLAHESERGPLAASRPEVPGPRLTALVVYRGPEGLEALEIEPAALALLDALADGTPLGEACTRVADRAPIDQADVTAWFTDFAPRGFFSAVTCPRPSR